MADCRDCLHYEVCNKCFPKSTNEIEGICNLYKDKSHYAEVVRCRECYYNGTEDCPMREFMKDEGLEKVPTADLNFCSYGEREETQCTRG